MVDFLKRFVYYLLVSYVISHFIVYCVILFRTGPDFLNQYICPSCIAGQDPGNCISTRNEALRLIQN